MCSKTRRYEWFRNIATASFVTWLQWSCLAYCNACWLTTSCCCTSHIHFDDPGLLPKDSDVITQNKDHRNRETEMHSEVFSKVMYTHYFSYSHKFTSANPCTSTSTHDHITCGHQKKLITTVTVLLVQDQLITPTMPCICLVAIHVLLHEVQHHIPATQYKAIKYCW